MKNLILIFAFNAIGFSQSSPSLDLTNSLFSFDIGLPKGFVGINWVEPQSKFFGRISGNLFSFPPEEETFDFAPNLFDDEDRGKHKTYVSIGGGIAYNPKGSYQLILGGLSLGFRDEYFKKYDSSEILADDGNYYVKDDDNSGKMYLSPYFGLMIRNVNSKSKGYFSFGVELNPLNVAFGYAFN